MSLCVHSSLQKENEDPKKTLGPEAYVPFYTKNNKLWRCDKTKQVEAVNCRTVTRKFMRGTNGRSGLLF